MSESLRASSTNRETRNGILRIVTKDGGEKFYASSSETMRLETEWYRTNGLFPGDRLRRDSEGNVYPIGDWSWNRGDRPQEFVEPYMTPWVERVVRERFFK